MSPKQRTYFFGYLWPKACRVQHWTGTLECETRRREATLTATKKLYAEVPRMRKPTDSMGECDRDQLTAVFNYAKWLGDPNNLGKTIAVVDPAEAKRTDDCRQVVWKINALGFTTAYIQRLAAWDCREGQVSSWTDLPIEGLKRVLIHATQRKNEKDKEAASAPQAPINSDEPRIYHLRRSPTAPKPAYFHY